MAEAKPKSTVTKTTSTATKKPAATKVAATTTATPTKAAKTSTKLSPEAVYKMIQDAAYFIAEKDGFAGDPHAYWSAAEAQIAAMTS
jgi:hypothetical protein